MTLSDTSNFARDPHQFFSRAVTLSGPDGVPWNAASLVGWQDRQARPEEDPWGFRLREGDSLPGFQGTGRNRFIFRPVAPGTAHATTRLAAPLPERADPAAPRPAPEGKEAAPAPAGTARNGYGSILIFNHRAESCDLWVQRFRKVPMMEILELDGRSTFEKAMWRRRPGGAPDDRVLGLPAGKAVRLVLSPSTRFGGKRSRRLFLDLPGGPAGMSLVIAQQARKGAATPWAWFLQGAPGAGLALGEGRLDILPLDGAAPARPGVAPPASAPRPPEAESARAPAVDEFEEVEAIGFLPPGPAGPDPGTVQDEAWPAFLDPEEGPGGA
jgi:hypothetical protein